MTLYYIHLGLKYDNYIVSENDLRYEFQLRTGFINHFFTKEVRKNKFKTDGSFNLIAVELHEGEKMNSKIVPDKVLSAELFFDRVKYKEMKGSNEESEYYLSLLEKGFQKAAKNKEIPLSFLQDLIKEFKLRGYKNEWLIKRKRFKDEDIEISLNADFKSDYFQLNITINQISTKKKLVNGVLARTEPDVSVFEGKFENIILEKDIIFITDEFDNKLINIDKGQAIEGQLIYSINGDYKKFNHYYNFN